MQELYIMDLEYLQMKMLLNYVLLLMVELNIVVLNGQEQQV